MASAFDDEDLSMSLAHPNTRRAQNNSSGTPTQSSSQRTSRESSGPPPPQTRSSQRLGQYDVKKTLGEGSFGKVKLAVHRVSGQQVALKIISRRKLISRDMAGRVEREIQYLQLLRHPHIIKLYTVITTPSEIIMVLEYAGGELFDYIVKHGKMPEDSARRFFQQIICAVEYCHRHKIVHRDLKPENLLLDESLNVKIADFGLSNIMTDGNFLKTSCGSPNYAAPEVISGKLYAGPEVDVWSCGVILYVLLVGRLPFDDEYIPSLFKKIASGNYHTPSYLSSGAVRIIKRMLVVNPVQRISVQEIRQDPWFNIGLADYLQPPVEEFIDTGVDPNKAIDPRKLAPGKPVAVQEQLHNSVVGKLGKTMGYAKDDVQEALQKDEPSAIKDAYLIVRENQIIRTNPQTTQNEDMQSFLARSPSPPAIGTNMSTPIPTETSEPVQLKEIDPISTSTEDTHHSSRARSRPTPSASSAEAEEKPYVSQIGILPSSMPYWHNQYMEKIKSDELNAPYEDNCEPDYATSFAQLSTSDSTHEQSSEDQAATARHLKPHSRSTIHLHNITAAQAKNPDALTPVPPRKPRPTKWQFGIRSRNSPLEAMGCIYRALLKQGAEWECPEEEGNRARSSSVRPEGVPVHITGAEHSTHALSGTSRSHSRDDRRERRSRDRSDGDRSASPDGGPLHHESSLNRDESDPSILPPDYIPADPWCIKVRWRKDGMYPPGTVHPHSTRGSKVDLPASSEDQARRRSSTIGSLSSAAGSATSVAGGSATSNRSVANDAVYIYMDVQLYQLEHDFYLVDFKCAGYEAMVVNVVGELVGSGYRVVEKDVTSPFPFLDAASKLIVQLAEAD